MINKSMRPETEGRAENLKNKKQTKTSEAEWPNATNHLAGQRQYCSLHQCRAAYCHQWVHVLCSVLLSLLLQVPPGFIHSGWMVCQQRCRATEKQSTVHAFIKYSGKCPPQKSITQEHKHKSTKQELKDKTLGVLQLSTGLLKNCDSVNRSRATETIFWTYSEHHFHPFINVFSFFMPHHRMRGRNPSNTSRFLFSTHLGSRWSCARNPYSPQI